jgi:hypothetical protein
MMQCIMCNKFSLFAPRLKALKNKGNTNILVKQEKFQMFLKWETLIHSYMKLKMNNIANATLNWIEVIFNWIRFKYI